MKNKVIRNTIISGALCAFLAIPTFTQAANIRTILADNTKSISVNHEYNHWSKPYIERLSKSYDVESIFKNKDLEAYIKEEDYKNIVRLVIDEEYERAPDAMTREAVVYDLVKIWAQKTGQDLDNIAVIEMLIYSDTNEIGAKYNHAITLAYMKNIARGKGGGIFDPKTGVTYGELAALINNTHEAIKKDLKSKDSSKVEESFETKGSYEIKNDNIIFSFELLNHYTEPKDLLFGSGQQFEITITDEKGEEVYRYSDGKFFTLAIVTRTINPGESIKWQDTWDMTNKDGERLSSGKYRAEIEILVIPGENDEKIDKNQLSTVIEFDLEEAGQKSSLLKPELAEEIIKETADKLIQAISTKDAKTMSDYVHPVKGVRFTPYTYVSVENDIVFEKEEVENYFENQNIYLWGHYDGTGDEILLTPGDYYEKFIYSEDFKSAEQVGYNEVLSSGNMLENQFEVYDNAIVVEYYFPGFNPDYAGLDWESLRLVFEQYEDSWYLVGIIHNQWTI